MNRSLGVKILGLEIIDRKRGVWEGRFSLERLRRKLGGGRKGLFLVRFL